LPIWLFNSTSTNHKPSQGQPTASAWLEGLSCALDAAKAAEAAHREASFAAVRSAAVPGSVNAANPQLVLLSHHVNEGLAGWESRALAQRSALDGLVGGTYARSWDNALRLISNAASSSSSVGAGASGAGGSSSGSGARGALAALPFMDCPPERRLLWRLLLVGRSGAAGSDQRSCPMTTADADAAWVEAVNAGGRPLVATARSLADSLSAYAAAAAATSSDPHAKPTTLALVRRMQRALEKRHTALARDAADHERLLAACGVAATTFASEAVHHRVEAVRLHKELHVAELMAEVAASDVEVAAAECGSAAAGQLAAVEALEGGKSRGQLQRMIASLKGKCEELASRKRFLHNQVLSSRGAVRALHHDQQQQQQQQQQQCEQQQGEQAGQQEDPSRGQPGPHGHDSAGEGAAAAVAGDSTRRPPAAAAAAAAALARAASAAGAAAAAVFGTLATAAGVRAGGSAAAAGGDGGGDDASVAAGGSAASGEESAAAEGAGDDEDSGECPICRCALSSDVIVLNCGHVFCESCASAALELTQACPYCRARVLPSQVGLGWLFSVAQVVITLIADIHPPLPPGLPRRGVGPLCRPRPRGRPARGARGQGGAHDGVLDDKDGAACI
jgi:hypothetical protein